MADLKRNSDNEHTQYASSDEFDTAGQNVYNAGNQPYQQMYSPENPAAQQLYGDRYGNQQQTPPQSQQPPQDMYGAPPVGYQPQQQNMYGNPPGYNSQMMRPAPVYKKKKSNTVLIVLIILIVLLLCIIAGVAAVILLGSKDDDDDEESHDARSSSFIVREEKDGDDDKKHSSADDDDDDKKPDDDDSKKSEVTEPETEAPTTEPAPNRYSMPNVCGMNGDEAAKILQDAGFIVEIRREYNSKPRNEVIRQSIPEKTVITEGDKIVLDVSLGTEESQEVPVPDVRGREFEDAKKELEKCELYVNTAYEESDTVKSGYVIEQNISPRSKVKKGTSILLTVSTGSKKPQYQQGRVATEETDLNVRKGPGKEFDVAGTVAKDSTVEVVELDGDWYKIVFKNGFGYVSKDYIELIN